MSEPLKITLVEGIVQITLNRPKFYNAFDVDMIHTLADKLTRMATDPDVGGIVITWRRQGLLFRG